MQQFRAATYNIHKCEGMDRRVSAKRIAEVIAEVNPDFIGLQEVLNIEAGPPDASQASFIAEQLGMLFVLGDVRRLRGGLYGNAVLSRFPLRSSSRYDLSITGREPRGCIRTDIDLGGRNPLHLFNVHLGTDFLERRKQAALILESKMVCGPDLSGPRIVLGDFNEWTRGLVSRVLSAEFRGADIRLHMKAKRTYPGILPLLHLDHIYYDEDLVLQRVSLHRTAKSLIASDHLPLVADFALKDQ